MSFRWTALLACLLACPGAQAQQPSVQGTARIEIISTDRLEYDNTITTAQRLIGHVALKHGNAIMRSDSAWLHEDQTMIAYGHIVIDHDTLHITGDRLDYVGATRVATITGHVELWDPSMRLSTPTLTYAIAERTARYNSGATIVSQRDNNTLTSRNGAYITPAHRFIFSDDVRLRHPDRTIDADTLHYTTTSGVAEFFGPTRITQGETRMWTDRGTYDTRTRQGRFTRNGRVVDGANELSGDTLHYDQRTGDGAAWGNVTIRDSVNHLLVRGARGWHSEVHGSSKVTGSAELVMLLEDDSLFLHGDTLLATIDPEQGRRVKAYAGVRFFKADMQGVCDTMTYADRDSLITLKGTPFLWSGKDQISGALIRIQLAGGKAHRLHVGRDGLVASQVDTAMTDTARAFFDQVAGTALTGYFNQGTLSRIDAEGNSRTVYFAVEKDSAGVERTTGMNRIDCSRMNVRLEDGRVSNISFITQPEATLYPIQKAPQGEMRMRGFVWNASARPKDRADIFRKR